MAKKIWLSEVATMGGIPDRTFRRWWHAFCTDTGQSLPPRQADTAQQEAFFAWLQGQSEHEAAHAAQRLAARTHRQHQAACAQMVARLERLIDTCGFDTVLAEVIEPLCTSRGRLLFRPHRPPP
jgi:adenosylmethionine-8-amino-7-oxononanoate aminotransferase